METNVFLKKALCVLFLLTVISISYADDTSLHSRNPETSETQSKKENKMTEAEINRLQQRSIKFIKQD